LTSTGGHDDDVEFVSLTLVEDFARFWQTPPDGSPPQPAISCSRRKRREAAEPGVSRRS
jgi:hypothetical protein